MSVAENVAYGLRARGVRGQAVRERVERNLAAVQLSALGGRLPRQLSGGQQQRVALARALTVEPSILLLDEPFAALDRSLRLDMQIEVKRLQRQLGLTTILVTHDQDEAMSVADRIAVMNKGKVEQFDTPVSIYDRPQTLFVNGFIGTTNLLPGRVVAVEGQSTTVALDAGGTVRVDGTPALAVGEGALLSIRPEQLVLSTSATAGSWPIEPGLSLPLGAQLVHEVRTRDGLTLKIVEPRLHSAGPGPRAFCALAPDAPPDFVPAFNPANPGVSRMTRTRLGRRNLMAATAALGGITLLPRLALAKGSVTPPRSIPAAGRRPTAPSSCRR